MKATSEARCRIHWHQRLSTDSSTLHLLGMPWNRNDSYKLGFILVSARGLIRFYVSCSDLKAR